MQKEYDALVNNGTWKLVPLLANQKAIGCKWVFRVEILSSGLLNNYERRVVALGYLQKTSVDFY